MVRTLISKPVCQLLLIVTLGILGYSNTLNVPFQFDDWYNIETNPVIKNLDYYVNPSKAKVIKSQAAYPMLSTRYIGSLSFALNYKIHGLDVTGYHIVNLLIHLINSLLVYWFIHLIFISLGSGAGGENHRYLKHASTIAFFSSLLFVTHPIQSQAVTYVVQRFTSLATTFYLFSIIMYIKARLPSNVIDRENHRPNISTKTLVYYILAFCSAALAMATKQIALTLPFFIILYDWYFIQNLEFGWLKKYGWLAGTLFCLLVLAATFYYLGKNPIDSLLVGYGPRDFTLIERLLTELRVVIFYISLLFLPSLTRLNLDHDFVISQSLLVPLSTLYSLVALTLIFGSAIIMARRQRVLSFCIIWFFGNLAIESTVMPLEIIFEHRLYLPSIGFFLGLSFILVTIIERCQQPRVDKTIFLTVILVSLVFTGITFSRNIVWNDKVTLWQDVIDKSPKKARGPKLLGWAYKEEGNAEAAILYYKKSIFLDPTDIQTHVNLASLLDSLGRKNEANQANKEVLWLTNLKESIKKHRISLRKTPNSAEIHNNLGIALGQFGRTDEAIKEFRAALKLKPDSADIKYNLKIALESKNKRYN